VETPYNPSGNTFDAVEWLNILCGRRQPTSPAATLPQLPQDAEMSRGGQSHPDQGPCHDGKD
jgi:hypothetical protein